MNQNIQKTQKFGVNQRRKKKLKQTNFCLMQNHSFTLYAISKISLSNV